ncbi:MAG: hypothetical protein J7M34_02090 [Anaerolineae bacterium]|nr:hypothetical protein [Anaerolineae bacterium]
MTSFQIASIIAAVSSGLMLVIGFVWIMAGRASWQRDDEVARRLMAEDEEEGALFERSAFRGKAIGATGGYEIGFGEIITMLKEGELYRAAPILLLIVGMLGLLLSIGLVLVAFQERVIGALFLAMVAYTFFQMARAFRRAARGTGDE